MSFFGYFTYYQQLTRARLPLLLAVNGFAVLAQMGAAAALFSALSQFGVESSSPGRIMRAMSAIFEFFGLFSQSSRIAAILSFATLAFAASSAAMMLSMLLTAKMQSEILVRIQPEGMERLVESDYEHFQTQNVGKISNVLVQQIKVVAQSFKLYSDIMLNSLFAFFYIIGAFAVEPFLCVALIALGAPLFKLVRLVNRKSQEISVKNVNENSRMNAIIIQSISNLKYLKATSSYRMILPKIRQSSEKLASYIMGVAFWSALGSHATTPFAIGVISLLVYWQIVWLERPISAALLAMGLLYAAAQKVMAIPSSYQKFLVSAASIQIYESFMGELKSNAESLTPDNNAHCVQPDFRGAICLKDVSFRYRSAKDDVLRSVSLKIEPNSSVAFVGGSGAGKSTVVNLITGLLKPSSGQISLSGTDYRTLDMNALRENIGYVTQESVIFNASVSDNISLWSAPYDSSRAAIEEASSLAHADIFIKAMPEGYKTLLGDNGINISGGQRQRISIARELFRKTPLLILDEATSALDSETEKIIHDSIEEFKGRKTLIIIAHRLATIKSCDIIYVLDGGRVLESGSYETLCSMNGKFREMIEMQKLRS